ncbi:MAG: glycosyltransferase WbuB, partial [Candidatus Marsarchaeota archaeon]|nr:glycosyltransferase WbuB [Candidatus Marsarchaeota archaeon]
MSRRVCHVVQSYYPRDPRIRRQAEALAEAGHSVQVVCLRAKGEKTREVINGVMVYRLPLERKRGTVARYLFEYLAFFIMAS